MSKDSGLFKKFLVSQFPYSDFRGEQETLLELLLLRKQSGLIVMPTGGGKSLCYQFPALWWQKASEHKLVLVLSPLAALMQDQVQLAEKLGIQAGYLSHLQEARQREFYLEKLNKCEFSLFFVTPERFRKMEFRAALQRNNIGLVAVDEAHCISLWGHDFRPDYSRIGEFICEFAPESPILALTATATPEVQKDICDLLNIPETNVLLGGFERTNLKLMVIESYGLDDKLQEILRIRKLVQGPMIVYFSLIASLEKIADGLRDNRNLIRYHGQLTPDQRKMAQKNFLQKTDDVILLATPAFGLGIDKPNIRCIVHAELPMSIEAYYQEIGRAGRDHLPSSTYLLRDQEDLLTGMEFIKWSLPEPRFLKQVYQLLRENHAKYIQEGNDFLRKQLNFYNSRDFRVETALNQLERAGILELIDERRRTFAIKSEFDAGLFPEIQHKKQCQHQNIKLKTLWDWANQTKECRLTSIYKYFGATELAIPCGVCDVCLGEAPTSESLQDENGD